MTHTGAGALNAAGRERGLAEATDGRVVDLLVVGLGVTGAGVALDAAARGLDVVAVDANDLAFGTSRWSSKLVHGGLRYLAQGQLGVAHESAVERGLLMTRTAPHLTRALPMLIPLVPMVTRGQAATARAGLLAGDALRSGARTPHGVLPRPRRLGRTETLALAPSLRSAGLRGGLLSWDGQLEDDARLVVALARTAAGRGARVLTRTRVEALSGDGASVRDEVTGAAHTIRARAVVNATGVWAGTLDPGVRLRPSRGTHLVLGPTALPGLRVAVMAPVPGERNRFVFALPQPDGRVYVGLTDEPVDGPLPDVPEPTEAEIGFLLDVISAVLDHPFHRHDVAGAFAGLRPLLDAGGRTADLSRRHAVLTSRDGIVTIVGGKLTTYRRMAEDAVDAAVARAGLTAAPCATRALPLVGAAPREHLAALEQPPRLVRRYGTEAADVLVDARARTGLTDDELLSPVADGVPTTLAELVWGVTHEGALDVADLLDRRTRVGLVAADRVAATPAAEHALIIAALTPAPVHPT
ncbi:MAG TPA: glycerol-3-phosphate dehydrogenase/oxidase [Nocardioides sp.]|uniref:glycerol-3-phosphate dehydrogenase/oxidase n=1 Tax=Nocardioides sp. TaxID=35761 RepID=UPI002D807B12|nr:glycerol-3-phosphate dehydrogenase/oxidase [Nocardioides sp.]HET6651835.1 glycerol-3-phosphate dehydrogenase/oxidase [Nocardioides sp.]